MSGPAPFEPFLNQEWLLVSRPAERLQANGLRALAEPGWTLMPELSLQFEERILTPVDPRPFPREADLRDRDATTDTTLAQWILDAEALGFCSFSKSEHRAIVENVKDGVKVHSIQPSATSVAVPILVTMRALIRASIARWVAAGDAEGPKAPLAFGSTIRGPGQAKHTTAEAVDLPETTSPDRVKQILSDLPRDKYGIGLPFSADFFDDELELARKEALAIAAAKAANAQPAPGQAPVQPAAVADGLVETSSWYWSAAWDVAKASYAPIKTAGTWNRARTTLQNAGVKDHIDGLIAAGTTLCVFPDRGTAPHMHIQLGYD
jgi:hypothetical protein